MCIVWLEVQLLQCISSLKRLQSGGSPPPVPPRGPKASHQRKLLTAVKFWTFKSRTLRGANWYLYCPGPRPTLNLFSAAAESAKSPSLPICQQLQKCDGGCWERSCQWRNLEMGQRILSIGHAALGTPGGKGKWGGSSFQFNYEHIPRRGWWRGPPHNGHTPESRKLGHRSWRAGAKIPGAARRSPGRSPSRRPSTHLDPSRAVSTCAAVTSHFLLQTGRSCRPLWRSVCDVGSRKRHRPARQ